MCRSDNETFIINTAYKGSEQMELRLQKLLREAYSPLKKNA